MHPTVRVMTVIYLARLCTLMPTRTTLPGYSITGDSRRRSSVSQYLRTGFARIDYFPYSP